MFKGRARRLVDIFLVFGAFFRHLLLAGRLSSEGRLHVAELLTLCWVPWRAGHLWRLGMIFCSRLPREAFRCLQLFKEAAQCLGKLAPLKMLDPLQRDIEPLKASWLGSARSR